jgi:hypothetical protein
MGGVLNKKLIEDKKLDCINGKIYNFYSKND